MREIFLKIKRDEKLETRHYEYKVNYLVIKCKVKIGKQDCLYGQMTDALYI